MGLDRPVEARARYRQAVALNPAMADAWYNLAHQLERAGRTWEARDCLERAVAADTDYPAALFDLARLTFDAGRHDRACALFERYLQAEDKPPWNAYARRAVSICRLETRRDRTG